MPIDRKSCPLVLLCIGLAGFAAGCGPLETETRPKPVVIAYIGYLQPDTDESFGRFSKALKETEPGLFSRARIEYVKGSDSDEQALAAAITQAAQRKPAALVAPTGTSAQIASRVAQSTPIVFASFYDPVKAGFAKSMRTPGGNVTGVSQADWLDGKRLEILQTAFPAARRIAVLGDRNWAAHYDGQARIASEAQRLGLDAKVLLADTLEEVEHIMNAPAAESFDAWYVPPTYVAYIAEQSIIDSLRRLGVPGMFGTVGEVVRGGDMAYVQDTAFVWPAVARLVARVVSGEAAGTIPIESPRRYLLVVRADARDKTGPISARTVRQADLVY
jgi:putative tryptophan/tyrosine transport system substrate-binding protein